MALVAEIRDWEVGAQYCKAEQGVRKYLEQFQKPQITGWS